MAQIHDQALEEASRLLATPAPGRTTIVTSPLNESSSYDLAVLKSASRIEAFLLKSAARNASFASRHRRRLAAATTEGGDDGLPLGWFLTDAFLRELEDEYQQDMMLQHSRKLQQFDFSLTASRIDGQQASPYCEVQADISFDVGAGDGALADQWIDTTDPGTCCGACLFRKDCYGWTVKTGLGAPLDGCYLRGQGFAVKSDIIGFTSGSIDASVAWKPPPQPTPRPLSPGVGKYTEVLKLGTQFFMAQRSGQLPSDYPIGWRRSSHLNDAVVGGFYDAGDTLKINFPLATTVSYIAWAMLNFPRAFDAADARNDYLAQLRVANDYMLGCYNEHTKKYVGQIGDPGIDHSFWGRADENHGTRPAYTWDGSMHGSDLLAGTAAAWAASSLVFRDSDPAYANKLKAKAKAIYAWAITRQGHYSDYYREAVYSIYPSTDYLDDQTWAAAWLFRCSGQFKYLEDAASFWARGRDNEDVYTSWDSQWAPAAALLRQISRRGHKVPGIYMYNNFFVNEFARTWLVADGYNDVIRTPKGMRYPEWSTDDNLQFSTATAMVLVQDMIGSTDHKLRQAEIMYARRQVDYALGSAGRSYIIGWGENPPKYTHHAGATCPSRPEVCDVQNFWMRAENPQLVTGALAGGPAGRKKNPDNPDYFPDNRQDWATGEPALDYNGGLVGALAGVYAYSAK